MFTQIFVSILAFLLTIFPSWGALQYNYQLASFDRDKTADSIVSAMNKQDISALEAMICKNIKDNENDLPGKFGDMFDAVGGNISKYRLENAGDFKYSNNGKRISQVGWDTYFSTTAGNFRMHILWEIANDFAPEETGIRRILLMEGAPPHAEIMSIWATEGVFSAHD